MTQKLLYRSDVIAIFKQMNGIAADRFSFPGRGRCSPQMLGCCDDVKVCSRVFVVSKPFPNENKTFVVEEMPYERMNWKDTGWDSYNYLHIERIY